VTIEFSCQHCGKALSTSDDKAGRKAKCPGCGEAVLVPSPMRDETDEDALPELPGETAEITCPMCGATNPARAKACESCGEPLKSAKSRARSPQKIEAGDVLSTTWAIFKQEMGLVIGGVIVAGLLNIAVSLPQSMLGFIAGVMQQQGERDTALLLQTVGWCFMPVAYLGQWFVTCGLNRMLLNISRGDQAAIGDIFSGGKYLWRMAGATILFGLMAFLGFVCLIIPGIIISLMFWAYSYVLVDEDPPGIDCLWRAKDYSSGNLGAIFVLGLAAFAINLLGFCALFVGLVFTAPLTSLMFAVAYCKMSGQRTAA
jgi:DNA-directed RNA polymerase subunit RPC12/RpoP